MTCNHIANYENFSIINFKSKYTFMKIWLNIILLVMLYALGGCRSTGSDISNLSQLVEMHDQSMDLAKLNLHIGTTDIAIVSDLATNRTMVIKNGVVRDTFKSLSGEGSSTALGIFTLHALEYCPPWIHNGRTHSPCSDSNRLGEYSLWFDGYLYGFHGRPDNYLQDAFKDLDNSGRSVTRGCLVAPTENLQNLVDLLFELPSLKNHEGAKRIQQTKKENVKENVAILFEDEKGYIPDAEPVRNARVGGIAKVAARLLVIDTSDWNNKRDTPEVQAFLSVLNGTDHSGTDESRARLVKDCMVKAPLLTYSQDILIQKGPTRTLAGLSAPEDYLSQSSSQASPQEQTPSIQQQPLTLGAGDLLVGVRANIAQGAHQDRQPIHFEYEGDGSMKQASFVPPAFAGGGESRFECSSRYYWSRQDRAHYISASSEQSSDCLSEAVGVLFDQQTAFQSDLVRSTLESSRAQNTMKCMAWGGGQGCTEKFSCPIRWSTKESCVAIYRLLYSESTPLSYDQIKNTCRI